MGFGTVKEAAGRLRREPLIEFERLLLDLMKEFMAGESESVGIKALP